MNFSTYGPFELREMSPAGIDKLFESIKKTDKNLQYAIGVYIVAAKDNDGELIPWYVGKTDNEFGKRLIQHFDGARFYKLAAERGPLSFFLIARVTPSGRLKKVTARMRETPGLKSIDRLEFALIGSCSSRNSELLNKREKSFHTIMHVPGYWNSSVEHYDDAARELAGMLKTRP
jgi:hypothetical protein